MVYQGNPLPAAHGRLLCTHLRNLVFCSRAINTAGQLIRAGLSSVHHSTLCPHPESICDVLKID